MEEVGTCGAEAGACMSVGMELGVNGIVDCGTVEWAQDNEVRR